MHAHATGAEQLKDRVTGNHVAVSNWAENPAESQERARM